MRGPSTRRARRGRRNFWPLMKAISALLGSVPLSVPYSRPEHPRAGRMPPDRSCSVGAHWTDAAIPVCGTTPPQYLVVSRLSQHKMLRFSPDRIPRSPCRSPNRARLLSGGVGNPCGHSSQRRVGSASVNRLSAGSLRPTEATECGGAAPIGPLPDRNRIGELRTSFAWSQEVPDWYQQGDQGDRG